MATINGKSVKVSTEGVVGYPVELSEWHTMPQLRKAIAKVNEGLDDLLNVLNGEGGGVLSIIDEEAYQFRYNSVIGRIINDLPTEVRGYNFRADVDFSDVPFLRTYFDGSSLTEWKIEGRDSWTYSEISE